MPIQSGEVLFKFSTKVGTTGNTNTGSGLGSLGKWISTTQLQSGVLHDLFDVITGDENAASTVDYRCVFIHNNTVTSGLAMISPKVWMYSEISGYANTAIAADNIQPSSINSTTAQAAEIANETTAPVAVGTWNSGTVKASGITLEDIPSGYCKAFWIRRTATNSSAITSDAVSYRIEFDTAA